MNIEKVKKNMKSCCENTNAKKIFGVIFIAVLFVALSVPIAKYTIGQFQFQKGKSLSLQNQYSQALQALDRAAEWQPRDAAIQHELGLVYLQMALSMENMLQKVMAAKAVSHFVKAREFNSLDPETAYTLARASELLGEKSSEQTLAAYRSAIELWPNNSMYWKAFALEVHRRGGTEELLAAVQTLGRIDPASYGQQLREPYWSEDAQQAFTRGVETAIADNISLRQSHMTLADILAKQSRWQEAAVSYQAGMDNGQHSNTPQNFYHLGSLFLRSGNTDEAVKMIISGLSISFNREKDLENLYAFFRDAAGEEEQLAFYRKVRTFFPLSYRLEILMVRTLVDAKHYDEAKDLLQELVITEQNPEPWYWLARIGELTGDWDVMELAIQKASVRQPGNSDYHFMFSRALEKQQKYALAEEQDTRAIETREKPAAWLYNHRASMRWQQKNYEGALEDWKEASLLQPENASFYAQMAQAYKKLGQNEQAMIAYGEALERDPNNERYKKELGIND